MNWYKKAQNNEPYVDLFSKEFEEEHNKRMQKVYEKTIEYQNQLAKESNIFRKILESERKGKTIKEWYESTNNPKSKTRNALLSRHIYKTTNEWENDLKTNPFYEVK